VQCVYGNAIICTYLQELFVQDLARMSLRKSADHSNVDYSDLADIVDEQETLQFLQGKLNL